MLFGSYTLYNVCNGTECFVYSQSTPVENHTWECSVIVSVNFATGHISLRQIYIGSNAFNGGNRMGIETIYYT